MRSVSRLAVVVCVLSMTGAARAAEVTLPAAPPAPTPPGELPPLVLDPKLKIQLELHGSLWLWLYQPLTQLENPIPGAPALGPSDTALEIYVASVEMRALFGRFAMYVNPRFRDTKSRDFFTSNVWLQQGYVSCDLPHALIKVGKVESALSRLSDDTFYLNLLYFDGIKYDEDYGLSVEGSFAWDSGLSLAYAAQYFVLDGGTNGSLQDRDTVWIDGGHRRSIAVARVEPGYRFNKESSLRLGLAAQVFQADLGTGVAGGAVARVDGDLSFVYGPARVFVEGLAQFGKSVTSYPFASTGQASAHDYYALTGAGFRIWRFYPRYTFSLVRYADLGVTEMIHVPGVTFTAHDNVQLMFEYAYWPRSDPTRSWLLDSSVNLLVNGHF